jgi:N-acetylglutamate synthase-like GNAT family acetyltransferase
MNLNVHLRPAAASDAQQIRSLIHRVQINPIGLNWKHFVIAETEEGTFAGCGQLKPHADGSVELASIAVEEAYRRQRIATTVVEYLLAHSPRPLYLTCRPELVPFYARVGFKPVEFQHMPPYFKRIIRIVRLIGRVAGRQIGPQVMRLDP